MSVGSTCQAQRDIIFELRRIAFDAESDPSNVPGSGTEKRKAMYTKDYKMLGFTVSFPKHGRWWAFSPDRKSQGPSRQSPENPSFAVEALAEMTLGSWKGLAAYLPWWWQSHKFMCNIWPVKQTHL